MLTWVKVEAIFIMIGRFLYVERRNIILCLLDAISLAEIVNNDLLNFFGLGLTKELIVFFLSYVDVFYSWLPILLYYFKIGRNRYLLL